MMNCPFCNTRVMLTVQGQCPACRQSANFESEVQPSARSSDKAARPAPGESPHRDHASSGRSQVLRGYGAAYVVMSGLGLVVCLLLLLNRADSRSVQELVLIAVLAAISLLKLRIGFGLLRGERTAVMQHHDRSSRSTYRRRGLVCW